MSANVEVSTSEADGCILLTLPGQKSLAAINAARGTGLNSKLMLKIGTQLLAYVTSCCSATGTADSRPLATAPTFWSVCYLNRSNNSLNYISHSM